MGKKSSEHRKKVAARNANIKTQKKKFEKAQHDWLMDMINKEKAAGKFDNVPQATTDQNQVIGASSPILTEQQGPII